MSYLGPFNKEFRELLITRDFYGGCVKLNIPVTKDMQVTKFLVDDSEVGEWTLQVHNSLVTNCIRLVAAASLKASQSVRPAMCCSLPFGMLLYHTAVNVCICMHFGRLFGPSFRPGWAASPSSV